MIHFLSENVQYFLLMSTFFLALALISAVICKQIIKDEENKLYFIGGLVCLFSLSFFCLIVGTYMVTFMLINPIIKIIK